ncbi:MAG: hypothetical protein K1X86_15535 [Ignavibacteria bacterium]|nr:hypothetical protein [Ignavibacteria bacterium]
MAQTVLGDLKNKLKEKNLSHAVIASGLTLKLGRVISKSTVTRVLNGCYEGSASVTKEVITYCNSILEDKPVDLAADILSKSLLYERLMKEGSLLNCFSPEERISFIESYKKLKKYNRTKKADKKKKQII